MTDTILVTGSTGNVGSQVVKQLSAVTTKSRVRAAVTSKDRAGELKDTNAELVEMNFNNPETVRAALQDVQKVFLLTPLVSNMEEISAELIEQAKKAKVRHIVKQSAFGADREPGITMNKMHRHVEKVIESSGINYTFLRPMSFMQNYLGFSNSIKTQGAFYVPLGDSKTSFVDTRDIAAVGVTALTNIGYENKAYDITGPAAVSNYEIADILSIETGRKIAYVDISDGDARRGMKDLGMDEWMVEVLMELYGFQKAGYASMVTPNVEEVTGRKSTFTQFVRDNIEAFVK
jgi:uncharacterized protein YbjT (DUF2867 family)